MYDLARGPFVWVAVIVFVGGTVFRIIQLATLTKKREKVRWPSRHVRTDSPGERKSKALIAFQHSLLGQHPVMAIVSAVFHCCIFVVPAFALGHNLLLRESWGFSFFSFPDALTDLLTVVVLAGVVFFLVRRLAVPRVRAVSTRSDYIVLLLAAAPFLTGFIAYRQWLDYRTAITIHMLAGEVLLIAIPFTKLAHMIFFLFARLTMTSEFNVWGGRRTWST